jgi:hypothetical protein
MELFKSNRGSFEFRSHSEKWGISIDESYAVPYQLFVNNEGIRWTRREAKEFLQELQELLANEPTQTVNQSDTDENGEETVVDKQIVS